MWTSINDQSMMAFFSSVDSDDTEEGDDDDNEDTNNTQCQSCYTAMKKKIEQVNMIIYGKHQQRWIRIFSLFSRYYSAHNLQECHWKIDLSQNCVFVFTKTSLDVPENILRTWEDLRHPKMRTQEDMRSPETFFCFDQVHRDVREMAKINVNKKILIKITMTTIRAQQDEYQVL